MSIEKAGKVQLPKLFQYCAAFVLATLIPIGFFSLSLPANIQTLLLILPLPLGILLGRALYYRYSHETVQYGDVGFTLSRGTQSSSSYEWNQFRQVSLSSDPRRGVSVRLYYEVDGEHVEIPASRTGIDPFFLRDYAKPKIKKNEAHGG